MYRCHKLNQTVTILRISCVALAKETKAIIIKKYTSIYGLSVAYAVVFIYKEENGFGA